MANILQSTFLNALSWIKMVWFFIEIPLNIVPHGPADSKPALGQIMAWHWIGDKPLSEPMMAYLVINMCHPALNVLIHWGLNKNAGI